jgi:hypothetical protein
MLKLESAGDGRDESGIQDRLAGSTSVVFVATEAWCTEPGASPDRLGQCEDATSSGEQGDTTAIASLGKFVVFLT